MPLDESYYDYPHRSYGMDHDRYDWSMLTERNAVEWPGGETMTLRIERAGEYAERLLQDMAHGFARKARRGEFRTDHAQKRSGQRGRPTGMAKSDLEAAKSDRVFFDEKEKTWVITASKGRTHVFSSEGMHVTSLHLDRRAIDGRLARRRWRRVEDAEFGEVREKLMRKID